MEASATSGRNRLMTTGRTASQPAPDDQHVIAIICDGYEAGMSHKAIAGQLGMARSSLRQWLDFGRAELESGDELGSLGRLYVAVQSAYARFESRKVATLNGDGSDKEWVRDLAHVTRRNPAEWAERRQVSIESVSVTITAQLPQLAEAELLKLLSDKLASGRKLLT